MTAGRILVFILRCLSGKHIDAPRELGTDGKFDQGCRKTKNFIRNT
jgi:hypothetical protein